MPLVDEKQPVRPARAESRQSFSLLWLAATAGYFAGWIMKLALPIVAARMTTSPLLVSGVTFALTAPWLLFGLQAGALADRMDRRKLLLVAAVGRLFALGLLALAVVLRVVNLPLLYAVAFILGSAEPLSDTSAAALVPMLVSPGRLEWANSRLIGAQQVIEVIAPPIGGAVTVVGLALAVGLGSAGYIAALVALLLLRGAFRPARAARRHLAADMVEGVRFLWQQPALRAMSLMAAVINACWTAWLAVLVLYALDPGPLRLTAFQYGLLLTGSGIGGMIGALLALPVQRWLGRRWLIGLNILGNALLFVAPALTTNAWLIGAAIIVGGIGGPLWGIEAASLQQRLAPPGLQGRVAAAYRFLGLGAEAIGPVIGGVVGQSLGIPAVFVGGALLTALMLIPFFRVVTEQALSA
ncbi:MAG TPA: MFS transporter [Ktedonobacterales bacterium]|nr:MFS transporter [Ktedonobacterales bacterium]